MELLITVASLAAAIYAVAPRERQIDARLKFGALDLWVLGAVFLAALYLEFYEFAEGHSLAISHDKWPKGLNPQNAIYLTIIVLIVWVVCRLLRTARFTARKITEFQELTEQLFWNARYGELLTLVEAHASELFRAAQRDFRFVRIANRLNPPMSFEVILTGFLEGRERPEGTEPKMGDSNITRLQKAAKKQLAALLPTYERQADAANDIIRSVLLAPPFIKAIATSRPYAALSILTEWQEARSKDEFVSRYFRELAGNTASVLYVELARVQESGHRGYEISPTNRLLHYFLSSANVAEQFRLYKPIGDSAVKHLYDLGRHPEDDLYNQATGPSNDEEMQFWPLYATIRFFDIMVTQALYQGIEWHMWLYYFDSFVELIVRNYEPDNPLSNPDSEFPLRYSRLLYELFDTIRGWILALEYVPEGQKNTILKSTRTDHENGNIPKSSILALSNCVRSVLESDRVGNRQRHMLANMALQLYFGLRRIQRDDYAAALANALKAGGFRYRRDDALYQQQLHACLQREEQEYRITHLEAWVDDLCAALGSPR